MIKRYTGGPCHEHKDGEYVEYEDYKIVESQRDRLLELIKSILPIEFNYETGKMYVKEDKK